MNILVTGGAGFIGSHLAERLLAEGHTVICLDNFDSFYDPAIKRRNIAIALGHTEYSLVEGDIRNQSVMEECLRSRNVDMVVHLAARAGVRPSIQNPELYYDVNVMGTLRVLEAMKKCGVKRMVFASSSSVYGNNSKVPFSETDNVDHPISPYAATKKAGELLCHTFHHLYGFDIFCLRFFTAYGPRQRPEMGIHSFVRSIRSGKPITLFGDGSTQRDYTYIDRIIDGVVASAKRVNGYEVINLGESQCTSLIDLVRLLEEECSRKAEITWLPMQPGDVTVTYADIAKAKQLLDYNPSHHIRDGLRSFVRWYDGR